jgi:hypothetical protein
MDVTVTVGDVRTASISRKKPVDGHTVERLTVKTHDGNKLVVNLLRPLKKQAKK